MNRRLLLLSALVLSVTAASCSAGFSRPSAESLVEGEDVLYALVDPDPNRNTDDLIFPLLATTDGRVWEPITGDRSLPTSVGVELNREGVAQECDPETFICYRVTSPDGGIRLEMSRDSGQVWSEVWSITAGRLDFQNRCCGSRSFSIRDLEYVPTTDLVGVALGEYGLLTQGPDRQIRVDTLGRPARPVSGFMVGLYIEPLLAGVLALVVGWVTTEQRLSRLRHELESRFGSDDHTWLTGRARQLPILLPLVFFVGAGGVVAAIERVARTAKGDLSQATGWFALTIAVVLVIGMSVLGYVLQRRQWMTDAETQSRAYFVPSSRKAQRATLVGGLSAVVTLAAVLTPLILWTTGDIDAFVDALKYALGAALVTAGGFWLWEASHPALPE
ncbi:MAG: hypothetical protein OER12_06920 [Acidimicrobiia bacterium]|nr:hypothetical protein [Acidimicrobiia bacterium]